MALYTCNICGNTDVDSWGSCVHCGTPFVELPATKTKAIIVGRHTPDLGSEAEKFDVVGNENVMFSLNRVEAVGQLEGLFLIAHEKSAETILLQNVPAILAAALLEVQSKSGGKLPFRMGLIISVPGPRLAGVTTEHEFVIDPDAAMGFAFAQSSAMAAEAAVKAANTRAKVERVETDSKITVRVIVDPVSEFKFDHIEWL